MSRTGTHTNRALILACVVSTALATIALASPAAAASPSVDETAAGAEIGSLPRSPELSEQHAGSRTGGPS